MSRGMGPNDEVMTEVPLRGGQKIIVRINPNLGCVRVEGAEEVDAVFGFRVAENDVTAWEPDDSITVRSRISTSDKVEIDVHRQQEKKWWWPLPKLIFLIGHRDVDLRLQNKILGWFQIAGNQKELGFAPDREAVEKVVAS